MPDDVLIKSVTAADHAKTNGHGGMGAAFFLQVMAPAFGPAEGTDLPNYWSPARDWHLRSSVHLEPMWSAAVNKAITKIASRGWEVSDTDESDLRIKRGQALYLNAEAGQGWVAFMSRHLRDYLTTDNGAFVEVVRASPAAGSKILGLMHLDSLRCTRTSDPDYPVVYRDRQGGEHVLRDYQVLTFVDMPSPSETLNGVGFSATSRAYRTIFKLAAMERFLYEKVSGSGATSIEIVQGLSETSLKTALTTADNQMVQKGAIYYKGSVIVTALGDTPITNVSIPLKSLPDGFNLKEERDNAYVIYANALGIPVQDIQPLSGQGLGTGTQTVILAEAEEGQGMAAWGKQWEHAQNEHVLPETTTFSWSTNDLRDQQSKANVSLARAQARAAQIGSGEITPAIALNIAVDAGDVPREFLPQDLTQGGTLDDTEKPIDAPVVTPDGTIQPAVGDPMAAVTAALARLKSRDVYADVRDLIDEEEQAAADLASEVVD